MEQIVAIRLTGHTTPYELSASAFERLERYLAESRARLATEPEGDEILEDLERSIGDRLASLPPRGDTYVDLIALETVLDAIGEVDTGSVPTPTPAAVGGVQRRRLARASEGRWLAGVAAGVASYSGIGVDWVRSLFVILSVFTGGLLAVAYLIAAFALPVERDSEASATTLSE